MIATRSNTADSGCTPTSSNCVVWQGPNIPCINLCTGDTVSTVVYKVATDLCTIKSSLDLTNLDLSCLVQFCTTVGPAPTTKTLSAVLDFIIKKVCCLNTTIQAGGGTGGGGGGGGAAEDLALPQCLQYQSAGQTVTELSNDAYTLHLGTQYCVLKGVVDGHTTTLTSHNTRITALEARPLAVALPTVTPNCILPSQATAMNVVLDELEAQYCLLRGVLGNNTQITSATAQQCANLGTANALSQAGFMSGFAGWNQTVTNMAQAFQNLWITVCDMRAAVATLKNCCGQSKCGDFKLVCDASTNNDRTIITLDFNPGTIIPTGYTNGVNATKVVIKNTGGTVTKEYTVDLVALAASGVYSVTVAGAGVVGSALNSSQPYEIQITATISKDGETCTALLGKTISVPCPIINNISATLLVP
jgi:hypothetical protein